MSKDASLPPPPATVHVDLDGAREVYEGRGWGWPHADDAIFESGMRACLDFFAENRITATLFVIARSVHDARQRPLLEMAVAQGHEIASHSLTHQYLTDIDRVGKRREIAESRTLLEDELGVPVRGFRAPGYRIDRESLELLAEAGYAYDSSAFPTAVYAAALDSSVSALRLPHRPLPDRDLMEWPMPDHRPFPIPFNPSYALVAGDWLFRAGLARFQRGGRPLTLLFHLIDFAEPLPSAQLKGLGSRIYTLSMLSAARKQRRCQAMLDLARRHYRITTTLEAIAEWQRGAAPRDVPDLIPARPASIARVRSG
jgi:peptidoglycan/xylan/chitin deacetylase (PgdA/CDA1 family)